MLYAGHMHAMPGRFGCSIAWDLHTLAGAAVPVEGDMQWHMMKKTPALFTPLIESQLGQESATPGLASIECTNFLACESHT